MMSHGLCHAVSAWLLQISAHNRPSPLPAEHVLLHKLLSSSGVARLYVAASHTYAWGPNKQPCRMPKKQPCQKWQDQAGDQLHMYVYMALHASQLFWSCLASITCLHVTGVCSGTDLSCIHSNHSRRRRLSSIKSPFTGLLADTAAQCSDITGALSKCAAATASGGKGGREHIQTSL